MLHTVIYTCVHGDIMDLLFHLYEEKHRGGGSGYQAVEEKMLFHLHVSLVCPPSSDSSAELLSQLFPRQPLKTGITLFSPTEGVLCFSLFMLPSWQNKTDCRILQVNSLMDIYKIFLSGGPDEASCLFFHQFTLNDLSIELMPSYPG